MVWTGNSDSAIDQFRAMWNDPESARTALENGAQGAALVAPA